MDRKELEAMEAKIESALRAAKYTSAEARPSIWEKETQRGTLQRIYLAGKKADGYVSFDNGRWQSQGISFMMLRNTVESCL